MRKVACLGPVVLLAGCASMPDFDAPDDGEGPTVATVVDKIQCEIAEARDDPANSIVLKGLAPFGKWSAAVALTLTVNDNVGTSATGLALSYLHPLNIAGTSWGFNVSPLLYQARTRTFSQNYTINLNAIPAGETCKDLKIKPHGFNLEGDLGLRDQIYAGLHSFASNQEGADTYHPAADGKALDNFGATVMFHVYKGVAGVGPTWTLVAFKNSGGVGYQRDDQHQIVITFAPAAPAKIVPIPKVPPKPSEPVKPAAAKVESMTTEEFLNQKQKLESYQTQLTDYTNKLAIYSEAKRKQDAAIAANAAAARLSSGAAAERAREANQSLVTDQAIRNLGQILSRP